MIVLGVFEIPKYKILKSKLGFNAGHEHLPNYFRYFARVSLSDHTVLIYGTGAVSVYCCDKYSKCKRYIYSFKVNAVGV